MIQGIKTENIKPIIRKRVFNFVQKLKEKPEVEGIVYLGGLADTPYKDFVDELSDIDIGIFLNVEKENLPEWLQPFSFYIVVDNNGKEIVMEVNLHQKIYTLEKNSSWHDHKRELYKYASEVVFDRNGKIKELIEEKTPFPEDYRKLLLARLLSRIYWSVEVNPVNAIKRGLLYNAEELLNEGLSQMLDLLFVYNTQYPPAAKWKVAMLGNLEYSPNNLIERVERAFIVNSITEEDILRRRNEILGISKEIEKKLFEEGMFKSIEEYCEYDYTNWNAQVKQLKSKLPYDDVVARFPELSDEDKKILRGLLCEYFITEYKNIKEIPLEELNEMQKNVLKKINF